MISTENTPLAACGRVLHDAGHAEAILDRVLERGRHIELRGRSYRTRHAPLDLNPGPEPPSAAPARISGNHRPEFPEPTPHLNLFLTKRPDRAAAWSRTVRLPENIWIGTSITSPQDARLR